MSERTPDEIEASRLLPAEPESTGIRLAAIERVHVERDAVQVERDAARRQLATLTNTMVDLACRYKRKAEVLRQLKPIAAYQKALAYEEVAKDIRSAVANVDLATLRAGEELLLCDEIGCVDMPEPIGTEMAGHADWLAHGHQADWQAKHKGEPSNCAACKDIRPYAVVIVGEVGGRLVMAEYPKAPGAFVLPGGKVEHGEEPRAAAMREWAEETGYFAATLDQRPFFKGEAHNGKLLWAYRANVWGSPADEWDGPEGRCRLVPIEQAAQGYHQPFVGAFGRVMAAYQEVGGEWGPGRVTGRGD